MMPTAGARSVPIGNASFKARDIAEERVSEEEKMVRRDYCSRLESIRLLEVGGEPLEAPTAVTLIVLNVEVIFCLCHAR